LIDLPIQFNPALGLGVRHFAFDGWNL
jgi:hypothetical protein